MLTFYACSGKINEVFVTIYLLQKEQHQNPFI